MIARSGSGRSTKISTGELRWSCNDILTVCNLADACLDDVSVEVDPEFRAAGERARTAAARARAARIDESWCTLADAVCRCVEAESRNGGQGALSRTDVRSPPCAIQLISKQLLIINHRIGHSARPRTRISKRANILCKNLRKACCEVV